MIANCLYNSIIACTGFMIIISFKRVSNFILFILRSQYIFFRINVPFFVMSWCNEFILYNLTYDIKFQSILQFTESFVFIFFKFSLFFLNKLRYNFNDEFLMNFKIWDWLKFWPKTDTIMFYPSIFFQVTCSYILCLILNKGISRKVLLYSRILFCYEMDSWYRNLHFIIL